MPPSYPTSLDASIYAPVPFRVAVHSVRRAGRAARAVSALYRGQRGMSEGRWFRRRRVVAHRRTWDENAPKIGGLRGDAALVVCAGRNERRAPSRLPETAEASVEESGGPGARRDGDRRPCEERSPRRSTRGHQHCQASICRNRKKDIQDRLVRRRQVEFFQQLCKATSTVGRPTRDFLNDAGKSEGGQVLPEGF